MEFCLKNPTLFREPGDLIGRHKGGGVRKFSFYHCKDDLERHALTYTHWKRKQLKEECGHSQFKKMKTAPFEIQWILQ